MGVTPFFCLDLLFTMIMLTYALQQSVKLQFLALKTASIKTHLNMHHVEVTL